MLIIIFVILGSNVKYNRIFHRESFDIIVKPRRSSRISTFAQLYREAWPYETRKSSSRVGDDNLSR